MSGRYTIHCPTIMKKKFQCNLFTTVTVAAKTPSQLSVPVSGSRAHYSADYEPCCSKFMSGASSLGVDYARKVSLHSVKKNYGSSFPHKLINTHQPTNQSNSCPVTFQTWFTVI